MTADPEAFYLARDRRTLQYGGTLEALTQPVMIMVGADAAVTRPGQVYTLALVNMLARVHRSLHVVCPDAPLLAASLAPAQDLHTAVIDTIRAINPVLKLTSATKIDAGAKIACRVGVGYSLPKGMDVYAGWEGGRGEIDTNPVAIGGTDGDVVGAATAACLAAAVVFRFVHGHGVRPARLNPVERTEGSEAGTSTIAGPINVGDVLIAGAGAVTHGLLYWLRELGVEGLWDIVDQDIAELHNTNRCLGMTAADTGWPEGTPSGTPLAKAAVAAALIGANPHTVWYDEYTATHNSREHDLVLPLANERGVRASIVARGEPLLLHATTSPNWSAELHRHLPDRDDCPACRLPDDPHTQFACSTGPADPEKPLSGDAALPFLSASAGLLLACALARLSSEDELVTGTLNHWRLDLTFGRCLWQAVRHPVNGCPHQLSTTVRQTIHAPAPRRWDAYDRAAEEALHIRTT